MWEGWPEVNPDVVQDKWEGQKKDEEAKKLTKGFLVRMDDG